MAIQEVDEDEEAAEEEAAAAVAAMMAGGGGGHAGGGGGFGELGLRGGEDDVEEVDVFSPIVRGPGEIVEEKIYEEGEEEEMGDNVGGLQPAAMIKAAGEVAG
jgi:hypothetical protein